jgi:hypothetical protein
MDPHEQRAAEEQLALLEFLLPALERRREVLDVVWAAVDKDQAAERLRDLLGDGADPLVVLDMQVWRMTAEAREEIGSVAHL